MPKPFSCNSFYELVLRKITISVMKMTIFLHGGKSEIFILPYVLDLMDLLEQKFCQDSNLRAKLMYESVKQDVLIRFSKSSNSTFLVGKVDGIKIL